MPPKTKNKGKRSKKGNDNKGVKRTTAEYCTLLDKMYNNKDSKEVVGLILSEKYCMGSMFTHRRPMVFICPNKLSDISDVSDLKSHMLKGKVGAGDSLMTYSGEFQNWLMRNIEVKSPSKIVVDGVDCSLIFNHQESSVYKASRKLPNAKVGKSLAQEGGDGFNHMYNELNGSELTKGKVLRESIVRKYKTKFPQYMYPFGNSNHWANRCYSSLCLHLNENIPNFGDIFLPMLNKEKPYSALEPLLQYRIEDNDEDTPYFVEDHHLQSFMRSPHFLSTDDNILSQSYDLHDMFIKSVSNNNSLYHENPISMRGIIDKHAGDLFSDLKLYGGGDFDNDGYPTHPDMTNKIITAYRKVYGDLDHSNPGQYALYKKVYDNAPLVKLHLDLQRYVTSIGDPDHPNRSTALNTLFKSRHMGEQLELVLNTKMENTPSRYGSNMTKLLENPKHLQEFIKNTAFYTASMAFSTASAANPTATMTFSGDDSWLKKNANKTTGGSLEGLSHTLTGGHADMTPHMDMNIPNYPNGNAYNALVREPRTAAQSQSLHWTGMTDAAEVKYHEDNYPGMSPIIYDHRGPSDYSEKHHNIKNKRTGTDKNVIRDILGSF
jgi:hypothetical protein